MLRAISAAKSRHRSDMDQAKQAESDIAEAAEYLEHAAQLALACLLLVTSLHVIDIASCLQRDFKLQKASACQRCLCIFPVDHLLNDVEILIERLLAGEKLNVYS